MDPGRPGVWVCMSVKEESKGGGVIDVAMASQQTERDCEGLFPERLLAWADGDVAR